MRLTRMALLLAMCFLMVVPGLACSTEQVCTEDICTYYGEQPPYAKAEGFDNIHIENNRNAKDPTWQQLKSFILEDDTDMLTYVEPSFMCSDFAEQVHDRAENAGIKAALVLIEFNGSSPGHAINAFNTIDKGLVYIDCTGGIELEHTLAELLPQLWLPQLWPFGWDKVGYLEIGREYGVSSLIVSSDCTDYQCYDTHIETYEQVQEDFDTMQQQFIQDWRTFADQLETTQLQAEILDLDTQLQFLDTVGNESYIGKLCIQRLFYEKWKIYTSDIEEYISEMDRYWGGMRCFSLMCDSYDECGWYCNHMHQWSIALGVEKRDLDMQLESLDEKGNWVLQLGNLWDRGQLGNVSRIMIYW